MPAGAAPCTLVEQGYGQRGAVPIRVERAVWITTSNCDGRGTCPAEKDVIARIVGG